MASTLTAAQLAKLAKLSHLKSLAARTKVVTDDLQSQITGLGSDAIKTVKVNGTALTATNNAVDVLVAVEKKTTANSGYAASYTIKANGVALSPDIDIPKDFLVKSATLETCATADTPLTGLAVGDPYLDFVINTAADGDGSTETDDHIYINVKTLVDTYTNGNGLNLSSGEFSVKIDSSNANGLSVGSGGVALAVATDSVPGAMSAADHAQFTADSTKLSGISTQANKTTVTTEGAGTIEIDGTSKTIVEIAADADVATMLDEELPAPSSGE